MNIINVDNETKRVEIILNKSFYCVEAVKKAVEDFKEIGNFSVSCDDGILISIKLKNEEGIENIGYEFCNYVLALMKNEGLV